MKPDPIDNILAQAAQRALPPDAGRAAVQRIRSTVLSNLRPVRPLAPLWVFTLALLALFAIFAVGGALPPGLYGIRVLSQFQRVLIFPVLVAAAWLAAAACAREMRPAAGSHLGAIALLLSAGAFPVLFSLLFHDYSTLRFVHQGVPCLIAGLSVAIPTGLIAALILRRGFVMERGMAGIAAGTLAGLTGLGMLELHCPNLKAIHVIVWHVAVVIVSGILGFIIGWIADYLGRRGH